MGNVDYEWTGKAPDQGLPFPTPQSSPNAARDIKYLAEHIYIDADDSNLPAFTHTGPPIHFFGEGRPDAFGIGKRSNYAKLLDAPIGSTFTATTTEADNFGARVWRHVNPKTSLPWVCVEGDTGWCSFSAVTNSSWTPGWAHAFRRIGDHMGLLQYNARGTTVATQGLFDSTVAMDLVNAGWWTGNQDMSISLDNTAYPGTGLGHGYILQYNGPQITNKHITISGNFLVASNIWPSSKPHGGSFRTADDIRDSIEMIESEPGHENHMGLQQLRDELAELEGQSDA